MRAAKRDRPERKLQAVADPPLALTEWQDGMNTTEVWLPIPGLDKYEVSDFGQVRSWHPWKGTPVPRIRRQQTHSVSKYRTVGIYSRSWEVHRLVLLAFVGTCPTGLEGCHGDGDKANNALTNLRYGTHSENELDKVAHGTHRNASKTHCSKGHAFTPANTRPRAAGGRDCGKCRDLSNAARKAS